MTTTLDDLRADFEAAKRHFIDEYVRGDVLYSETARSRLTADGAVDYFVPGQFDTFSEEQSLAANRIGATATIYVIARDYGLQAAMLYKLSDGAIDPRKGGAK